MTRREVVARSACSLDDNADWIAQRKEERKNQGPVLVLDAGDYSMGTAFAAATRQGRPGSTDRRREYHLRRNRCNADRSAAPGQGWGDPPLCRDRARRHPL